MPTIDSWAALRQIDCATTDAATGCPAVHEEFKDAFAHAWEMARVGNTYGAEYWNSAAKEEEPLRSMLLQSYPPTDIQTIKERHVPAYMRGPEGKSVWPDQQLSAFAIGDCYVLAGDM
jgi:hypothetical protein